MAIELPQAVRQGACNNIVDRADAGAGAALVRIYESSGTPPDVDVAPNGTLLAELTMSDPAFGNAAADGTATASTITADSDANATGTADYFRVVDSDGTTVYQGTVGGPSSGADLELSASAAITLNQTVEISSLTLQVPETQS